MNSEEYLDYLIETAGENYEIGIQQSELKLLKQLIQAEKEKTQ